MTPNRTLALAKPKPKTNWFEFCLVLLGWIGIQIEKKNMSMVEPNLEGLLNQKKQVKNHYFPLVLITHFSLYKNFLSRSFAVNLFARFNWILCMEIDDLMTLDFLLSIEMGIAWTSSQVCPHAGFELIWYIS